MRSEVTGSLPRARSPLAHPDQRTPTTKGREFVPAVMEDRRHAWDPRGKPRLISFLGGQTSFDSGRSRRRNAVYA